MKKRLILVMAMLILFVGCRAEEPAVPEPEQPVHTVQTQIDAPEVLEDDSQIGESGDDGNSAALYSQVFSSVDSVKEQLYNLGCPEDSADRFSDWLSDHPAFCEKINQAAMEFSRFPDGTLQLRFISENNDRFSRYVDDASETVTYQLWDVEDQVLEGVSGVVSPTPPQDLSSVYTQELAGFRLTCPLWYMDLDQLDGFYVVDPDCAHGFVADCVKEESGLQVYSNGEVMLCFTEEGGPEILLHIHVQAGDGAYLGVGLGDSVEELIEALEQDTGNGEPWIIEYPERCVCYGSSFSLEFSEIDGVLTELWLYAYM